MQITVHHLVGGLESRIHAAVWPSERDRHLNTLDALAAARDAAQARIDALVVAARRAGASWAEIGRAVGLTRQAAHSRYRHRVDDPPPPGAQPAPEPGD